MGLAGFFVYMHPLSEFTEAQRAFREGNRKAASDMLSIALGSEKPLPVVENNIDRLLNPPDALASGILHLLLSEERKRS